MRAAFRRSAPPFLLILAAAAVVAGFVAWPDAARAEDVTFACEAGRGAKAVFLAGEFNNWNPSGKAMKDDDGDGTWTAIVDLPPGRYEYKFVVDGQWLEDPKAKESAPNPFGGKNSVVVVGGGGAAGGFVAGTTDASGAKPAAEAPPAAKAGGAAKSVAPGDVVIEWKPGKNFSQVFLAGEFNGWNATALPMTKTGDTWRATVKLDAGRYPYKFVADGTWMEDPNAAEFVDDGYGGKNSVLVVGDGGGAAKPAAAAATPAAKPAAPAGDPVEAEFSFQPVISGVKSVHLAGDFNDWSTSATPMADADGDGKWTVKLKLTPGPHLYKFVVDGATWMEDPNAEDFKDDGFGGKNSVIYVGGEGKHTFTGQPRRVEFAFKPGKAAQDVSLAGTFNNWAVGADPMSDPDGDGTWTITMLLPEGDCQYKFVADGQWITDEGADAFTDDGFGGKNSIRTVDDRFPAIDVAVGDGEIFAEGLRHEQTVRDVNRVSDDELVFVARTWPGDVEAVELEILDADGKVSTKVPARRALSDPTSQSWRMNIARAGGIPDFRYRVVLKDGPTSWYLGGEGPVETSVASAAGPATFTYSEAAVPRFTVPSWVQTGVFYQIFPERFANGDPANDPDFSEPYYKGRTKLPSSGKTNGEYYHLTKDWYDIAGLSKSPYRTDGRPDYMSFYGGDIAGIRQNLDYLQDLGVTILYFNPLFPARSNHKYEAYDYKAIDPHFGTPQEFRAFVDDCHARGIRIVADWVINHIGDHSPYFQDTIEKGKKSEYWDWFEWKKWPLPATEPKDWREFYECWWGFSHMPDLNYDLSRQGGQENGVRNAADAKVNQPVVDYILASAEWWMKDMDIDGFRLDVPNEVPFWVWKIFRDKVRSIKPDAYLVGEIWSDAGDWVAPDCFDATMNYKYFKDPVTSFIGQGRTDAGQFDRELAAGRGAYPEQAVRAMMNLVGSHDTPRYLTSIGGNRARQKLTALFAMTYVGAPHVYYGDEIAMEGGADPDCRRPFHWKWTDEAGRKEMHDWYRSLITLRNANPALSVGDFTTLLAQGRTYAYARRHEGVVFVVVLNAGDAPVEVKVPLEELKLPAGAGFEDALTGAKLAATDGVLPLKLAGTSGIVLRVAR